MKLKRPCGDIYHKGPKDELDRECGECRMVLLVLRDREDAQTAHDVRRGPCKCGAWH